MSDTCPSCGAPDGFPPAGPCSDYDYHVSTGTPAERALPVGVQEVARMFRMLKCDGCQVSNGEPVWYFQAGLVVRLGAAGFWLSIAPVRTSI